MLHRLKVSFASGGGGNGENGGCPPGCSERFKAANDAIRMLMREYPALQQKVEETERAFTTMTYAIRTTAASFNAACPDDPEIELASSALVKAGESMPCPRGAKAAVALRAYNDEIRKVQLQQSGAQEALRDRVYYAKKVNELNRAGGGDAIASKRARNERKLAEADADLEIRTEQIEVEVSRLLKKRKAVLSATMGLYVEQLANWCSTTQIFNEISGSGKCSGDWMICYGWI